MCGLICDADMKRNKESILTKSLLFFFLQIQLRNADYLEHSRLNSILESYAAKRNFVLTYGRLLGIMCALHLTATVIFLYHEFHLGKFMHDILNVKSVSLSGNLVSCPD